MCKCSNHNLIQTWGTAIARGFIQMTSSIWMKHIYSKMNSISPNSQRNSHVFSRQRTDWYSMTLEGIAEGHWKQSGLSQKKVSVHQKKESRYPQKSAQQVTDTTPLPVCWEKPWSSLCHCIHFEHSTICNRACPESQMSVNWIRHC